MKLKMSGKSLIGVAPLLLFFGGCKARTMRPAAVSRAQFVQAARDQDFQTMELGLNQPMPIPLGAGYSTPESQRDATLRGETLLMWALRTGRFRTALLLSSRAPTSKNAFGRTPLMYAALCAPEVGPDQDLFNGMLRLPNTQIAAVDNNGDSALFLTIRRGSVPFTESLLSAGAPVGTLHGLIRNKRGQTIVDVARATHDPVLMRLVAQATARVSLSSPLRAR